MGIFMAAGVRLTKNGAYMIFRLIILNGDRKGQQITVPGEPFVIGRGPDADLCLNDSEIASAHAAVQHLGQGLVLRDLGSMGKVLVNNHAVRETGLAHGDIIEIGHTRLLVQAVVEAEVRGSGPTVPRRLGRSRRPLRLGLLLLALVVVFLVQRQEDSRRRAQRDWSRPLSTGYPLEEIEEIRAAVEQELPAGPMPLAPVAVPAAPPAAAVAPRPSPPRLPAIEADTYAPDPYQLAREMVLAKVQTRMLEAQLLIASNRFAEADRLLGSIQQMAPEFAPAYAERAWLYEDRGMLQPAIDQWRELARLGTDPELAANARVKVDQLRTAQNVKVPAFADHLRIVSSEQRRFPDSGNGGEMRLVTMRIGAGETGRPIPPDAVKVQILFFDRDPDTQGIQRSRIQAVAEAEGPSTPWSPGEVRTYTATYLVPPPIRPGDKPRREQYYGHLVRLFYFTALQDELAHPPTLLDLYRTEHRRTDTNAVPQTARTP